MAEKKSIKLTLFWKIYIGVTASFFVLMGILLIWGYNVMVDYDESQRFVSMTAKNYATTIGNGSYSSFNDTNNAAYVFENETYLKEVSKSLSGKKIISEKGFSYDRVERPVYNIKADGKVVAEVSFKKQKTESKFGFTKYNVDKFSSKIKGDKKVDILLPEEFMLVINGVIVDSTWITETNVEVDEPVLEMVGNYNFEDDNKTLKYVKYSIEGLYEEPMIHVSDANNNLILLEYNEKYDAFCYIPKGVTIIAPAGFSVYLNNTEISASDKWIFEKDIEYKELSGISKYMDKPVTLVKYYITGISEFSVFVSAKNFDGYEVPVKFDSTTYTWTVLCTANGDAISYNKLPTQKFTDHAIMYARFVASDDDRWSTIMPDVMDDSELYKTFSSFWATLADHNSYWISDIKTVDISMYAKDAVSCRTSFVYWIKGFAGKPEATESYPTDITFYYVYEDGKWQITDWFLHDDSGEAVDKDGI